MEDLTYVFKGDRAYALHEGRVVGSSSDIDDLEAKFSNKHEGLVKEAPGNKHLPGATDKENRQYEHIKDGYLDDDKPEDEAKELAARTVNKERSEKGETKKGTDEFPNEGEVTTPNGLHGKIMGKVAGVFGEEVTVRLENGRIVHLPVSSHLQVSQTKEASAKPIEALQQRLAGTVEGTRDSLVTREHELETIQREAGVLIREGVSDVDATILDEIGVTASAELQEVRAAIAHLDDEATQAYAPPAPFSVQAADTASASLGGKDGSWLDHTVAEMIHEAEATDFKTLMDEGPEVFVAGLLDVALADTGSVRQMASGFIRSKTAGTNPEIRDSYERTWLARIEECRRVELANRKETTQKEAAAEEDEFKDAPDDAIFL